MRKTSHDGGDNTSITSGVENEVKKPIVGIIKTKRSSIKKKVQNFSHESDDAVIEPLLQKDKPDLSNQSAKHLLPKVKTESMSDDKDKLLSDRRIEKPSLSTAPIVSLSNGTKDNNFTKSFSSTTTTIHNHMNTNVFGDFDGVKTGIVSPKSQILVEIDGSKQSSYNPSPLIFTTAKIHSDGKTKHMEPVQVTPVPILSTIEGSFIKTENISGNNLSGPSGKYNNVLNSVCIKSTSPNTVDSKVPNEYSKTMSDYNNPSSSGFSSRILSENEDKKVLDKDSTSNMSTNDSIKSIISVDVNIILPAKTTKPELKIGTADLNSRINTISSESNGNKIDVNKNIETTCSGGHSLSKKAIHISDTLVKDNKTMHDIIGNKQLKRQKNSALEESDKNVGVRIDSSTISSDKLHKDIIDKSQSNSKFQHAPDYDKCLPKVNTAITTSSCIGSSTTVLKPIANIVSSIAKTAYSPTIPMSNMKPTGGTLTSVLIPSTLLTNTSAPTTDNTATTTMTSTNKPTSTTIPLTLKTTLTDITTAGKLSSFKPTVTTGSSLIVTKSETAATKSTTSSNITAASKPRITATNIVSTVDPSLTTTITISTAKPAVTVTTTPKFSITTAALTPTIKSTVTATTSSIDKTAVSSANITSLAKSVSTTSNVISTNNSTGTKSAITSKPSVTTTVTNSTAKPIVTATTTAKTLITTASLTPSLKPTVTAITSSIHKIADIRSSFNSALMNTNVTSTTKSTEITSTVISKPITSSTGTTSIAGPAVSIAIITTTTKPVIIPTSFTSTVNPPVQPTSATKTAIASTVTVSTSKPTVTTTAKTALSTLSSVTNTASKDTTSVVKPTVSTISPLSSTLSSTREPSQTVILANSGPSKTLKSGDGVDISEKSKSNTKPTTASVISKPQTISMATSKAGIGTASSNSPVTSTAKTQDITTQSAVLKATAVPVSKAKNISSKHSTSVISSKSPEVTSSSMKQSVVKPSSAKLSGSTGNSVKTLITSNEKSSGASIAGTKTSLVNKQTDSNSSDSKRS